MKTRPSSDLIDKYLAGLATDAERAAVESWYTDFAKKATEQLEEEDLTIIQAELSKRLGIVCNEDSGH